MVTKLWKHVGGRDGLSRCTIALMNGEKTVRDMLKISLLVARGQRAIEGIE